MELIDRLASLESTASYDYELAPELIAQQPLEQRDAARLLTLVHDRIGHAAFCDLPSYLHAGDLLVLNETRVIAARIAGRRRTGGRVELLLLHPSSSARYDACADRWIALAKPARRIKTGYEISFGEFGSARVIAEGEEGLREVKFSLSVPLDYFLDRCGVLPLPPYVREDSDFAQRGYQSVFACRPGSIAAPTASLHFTGELLSCLKQHGVEIAALNLDIGLGTFRPIQRDRIAEHRMHAETFFIPPETCNAIISAKAEGRRVVASGTTVVRAIEGSAAKHGAPRAGADRTDLYIVPGYRFRYVDGLITNFHMPRSSLLVLVCAFAGYDLVMRAYREAISRCYRFFSFGDAMLILP